MSDLLKQSAEAYQSLMPYKYDFVLGWKGQLRYISICFPEDRYHHLAGLHKVSFEVLKNKKRALRTVLADRVTYSDFVDAGASLEDRWEGICRLKEIIESNRAVFRYRDHEQPGSMIKGDYLMMDNITAFFIIDDKPESIFSHNGVNWGKGCPRFVTLQITRNKVASCERAQIYQAPTYCD